MDWQAARVVCGGVLELCAVSVFIGAVLFWGAALGPV